MLIQTIQANHNAGSIRIQLQKSTGQNSLSINQCIAFYITYCNYGFLWKSVLPILQVGVKPGQLVAVHQVLGVAKVWQRISVVAQVRQSVSMVVGAFHHGVQKRVLAVGCWVGPVGSI